jgi:polar amino acid transport system substrate-binding protein
MMRPHFVLGSTLGSHRTVTRTIFAAIIFAAVGQIGSAGSGFAASVDQAARALLPMEIRDKGVLTAAMPLDFEPYNFLDEKNEQVGLDVEVFRAVAETLGLKPDIQRLGFASVISAVSGGRVDAAMSSMGIIESRLKQVSFVRYALLTNGLIVRKGNPTNVSNKDACGHSIALEKGTQPVFVWEEKSKECEAAHRPKIEIMIFDGKGPQVLAVETGRAEAAGVSYATSIVSARHSNGKLDAAPGGPVPGAQVDAGIAFKKENRQLGKAMEAALKVLAANGTVAKIFEKWDLGLLAASPAIVE